MGFDDEKIRAKKLLTMSFVYVGKCVINVIVNVCDHAQFKNIDTFLKLHHMVYLILHRKKKS
jgi:hypothetical protein